VQALTPLAVVGLGILVARTSRRIQGVQDANRTVITRRLDLFSLAAPKLNRLLCFGTFVGTWKEITPGDALKLKRELDEIMYSNRLIFTDNLFQAYHHFMSSLFAMYATPDGDALLRTSVKSSLGDRRSLDWWTNEMPTKFSDPSAASSISDVHESYERLVAAFRADLYVTTLSKPVIPN
jgi:hypothetical protein